MTLRCKNCDQTILPSDVVCWHCGYELAPIEMAAGEQPNEPPLFEEPDIPGVSLTAVSFYALLTLATILLLVLTTRALAQYPLIQIDPQAPVKPGWTMFVDHRGIFTLDLPPQWTWLEDEPGGGLSLLTTALAASPQFETALSPLGQYATDTEVRLLAQAEADADDDSLPGFVVVGESARLNRLSGREVQALLSLGAEKVTVNETAVSQDLDGNEMITAVTQFSHAGQEWGCQQQVVGAHSSRFIVAVCQPGSFILDRAASNILSSFQLFSSP